jgi:hypothetical protein
MFVMPMSFRICTPSFRKGPLEYLQSMVGMVGMAGMVGMVGMVGIVQ